MHDIINRLRQKKGDEGFTLIELLVVVVIIGVLVAIAVPVYLNYRKGAADKSAQSDVRGAISAIEQYYTDTSNTYPVLLTIQSLSAGDPLLTIGNQKITLSDKTLFTYIPVGTLSYLVCAKNTGGSGKIYFYNSANGGSVQSGAASMVTCV